MVILNDMSKKNICGIITLYNPPASYLDNINTYINYLDILYLVDNTPIINHKDHDSLLRRFPEIEILSFGKNIGIAAALNLGIKEGLKNNYSWLLTMDQDSSFDEGEIQTDLDVLTHETKEKNMLAAIKEVQNLKTVAGEVVKIRLENLS